MCVCCVCCACACLNWVLLGLLPQSCGDWIWTARPTISQSADPGFSERGARFFSKRKAEHSVTDTAITSPTRFLFSTHASSATGLNCIFVTPCRRSGGSTWLTYSWNAKYAISCLGFLHLQSVSRKWQHMLTSRKPLDPIWMLNMSSQYVLLFLFSTAVLKC